jgi:tetraacyldisaccharide 4'-kinase
MIGPPTIPASSAMSRCCWRAARAPVAIGRDRPAAAQLLVDAGCDVIVSDDGLQHYALARDCEIVVIDGDAASATVGCCRPGRLREPGPPEGRGRVIVVNGGRALLRGRALSMRLEAKSGGAAGGAAASRLPPLRAERARDRRHRQPGAILQHAARHGIEVDGHPLAGSCAA